MIATSSQECSVCIRDASKDKFDPVKIQEFIGHSKACNGLALLPDSKSVVSISSDSCIYVYDIQTMERKLNFSFGFDCQSVCVSSKDNKSWIYVGGSDYTIKMYSGDAEFYRGLEAEGERMKKSPPLVIYKYIYINVVTFILSVSYVSIIPFYISCYGWIYSILIRFVS